MEIDYEKIVHSVTRLHRTFSAQKITRNFSAILFLMTIKIILRLGIVIYTSATDYLRLYLNLQFLPILQ